MKLQIQFIIIIIATLGGLVRRRDLATLYRDLGALSAMIIIKWLQLHSSRCYNLRSTSTGDSYAALRWVILP